MPSPHSLALAESVVLNEQERVIQNLARLLDGEGDQPLTLLLIAHDEEMRTLGCECSDCLDFAQDRARESELARAREGQ